MMLERYLDYEHCKCRKTLVDNLVEECTEKIDEKEIYLANLHLEKTISLVCSSCTIYMILFSLFFTINIRIGTSFVYYKYINHDKKTVAKERFILETTIYWMKNKFFITDLPWKHSDALIQPQVAIFGTQTLYQITRKENTNYAS